MKNELMYVEQKTGHSHNGPAWIGKAFFSKTGKTVYFNGMAFHRGRGIATEIITGDYYWISGVKKNGEDRHWAGNQLRRSKIMIDKDSVADYLKIRGMSELPGNLFEIVALNNIPPIEEVTQIENSLLTEEKRGLMAEKFSYAMRNKK